MQRAPPNPSKASQTTTIEDVGNDGTDQWSYHIGFWVRSSPAVVDGTVYVGGNDNNVYALFE